MGGAMRAARSDMVAPATDAGVMEVAGSVSYPVSVLSDSTSRGANVPLSV